MSPLKELVEELRAEGTTAMEKYHAEQAAKAYLLAADMVERTVIHWQTREVNLTQASEICGYSTSQLSRKVRAGKLRNYGRTNAPRVRVSELPYKPGHVNPLGVIAATHRPEPTTTPDEKLWKG